MGAVTVDFVMESVIDGNFIVSVIVDGVCKQLEPDAMSSAIVSPGMSPRCRYEEVSMDCLMEQRVDSVGPRTILQQWRAQFEPNTGELARGWILGKFANAGTSGAFRKKLFEMMNHMHCHCEDVI